MNTICLCEEHTKMIANMNDIELKDMLDYQYKLVEVADKSIEAFDIVDPFFTHMYEEVHGKNMTEILDSMKRVKDNAEKAIVLLIEEKDKRVIKTPLATLHMRE